MRTQTYYCFREDVVYLSRYGPVSCPCNAGSGSNKVDQINPLPDRLEWASKFFKQN